MISIIAAVAKNNVIGKKGALPWHLPEDLKHFRRITLGKTVVMGQKTLDSIVAVIGKPLPDRKNVVLTRNLAYKAPEGVVVYYDLNKALSELSDDDIFIAGGGEIFKQTFDLAQKLYITHIDQEPEGDVYFPEITPEKWLKTSEEKREGFSFAIYERKN